MEHYDIFISYKRKSLPTANNLYYRLTTRGYSTFFDLEEMRRDNFNVQLLNYIEKAKDVFVILEEGSLDGCKKENWENKDWFCHEIAFALEKKKNIIPILLGDYKMPSEDYFPDKLKELSLKHSPDFSFSFFDAYLDKLIEKKFITAEARIQNKATSVFKFYSNENCEVYKEGKLVCSLEGMSEKAYYLPVPRKGDYRFRCENPYTKESIFLKERIDADEDKDVQVEWPDRELLNIEQECKNKNDRTGTFRIKLENLVFSMIKIEGGYMSVQTDSNRNKSNVDGLSERLFVPSFYIGQYPVTQNIWEYVMGYNKTSFKDKETDLSNDIHLLTNLKPYQLTHSETFARIIEAREKYLQIKRKDKWHLTNYLDGSMALLMISNKLMDFIKQNGIEFTGKPRSIGLPELLTLLDSFSQYLMKDNGSIITVEDKKKTTLERGGVGMLRRFVPPSFDSARLATGSFLYGIIETYCAGLFRKSEIGHFPVESITHDEALEFVRRLSKMTGLKFSLPSEKEWEYAARAGQKNYSENKENFDEEAWYKGNSKESIHPVGEKKPNELEVFDLYGNVWEWTESIANAPGYYFIKGGSWKQKASKCQIDSSSALKHNKRSDEVGLRVVIRENVE